MPVPIWIQVRKAELIDAKTEWKKVRGDKVIAFKFLTNIQIANSFKLFKCFGGPLETDLDFAKFIFKNFGHGIYLCIARGKGHPHFFNFLFFEIKPNGSVFRRKPQSKTVKRKKLGIIAKNVANLKENMDDDYLENREWYDQRIAEEELDYFDLKYGKLERKKKRWGPYPYLKSVLKYDKIEDIDNKEKASEDKGMDAIW